VDDLVYIFPLFGLLAMAAAFAQAGNDANLYPPIVHLSFEDAVETLRFSWLNGIRSGSTSIDDWCLDDYATKNCLILQITYVTAQRLIDEGHVEEGEYNFGTSHRRYNTTFVYDDEEEA
jgi:hypothetical protein